MSLIDTPPAGFPVVGLGACTPLGCDAWSTAAAVRAGVSGFANHAVVNDRVDEPVQVAAAPWLDPQLTGVERFASLLFPAIEEAMQPWLDADGDTQVILALALPGPRPGLPQSLAEELTHRIDERFPGAFMSVAAFPRGHAAGAVALNSSMAMLLRSSASACLVAGVDSYLDAGTLRWLEAQDQLHGAGFLNNAWGFIPGEAAGAVMLANSLAAQRLRVASVGRVLRCGIAAERNRIKTDTVCIGEGLTAALREVLPDAAGKTHVTDIYCDMNGEPYRADEYGFAVLRVGDALASASDFIAPADCWGDVGAAGVPLHAGLATIAGIKGYARGPLALVWSSSEGGERGALLLRSERESLACQ